jgi:hypothetical protein
VPLSNSSDYALNGTQVRLRLPEALTFAGTSSDTLTILGDEILLTLGHLAPGANTSVTVLATVPHDLRGFGLIQALARVTSSTALPVETNLAFSILVR